MADAASTRDTNLPAELTSFVGRRAERAELKSLLTDSRLVTLTGFGGVGKTRLALRIAGELRRAFADGVTFVSLGEVNDPDWLPHAVASALGIEGRSTRTAPGSLVEYLASRELLLIMDNCEHVVDAAAMLVDTLLRTCPRLRVLATSRAALRIRGESVHAVAPLTIPANGDQTTPLHQFEAVTLFIDRAKAVVPEFSLTQANRDAVARICRKLEGVPLAVELAAVRLRAMTPQELAANLTERWELLTQGSRTAPDRQRTMAACIDWSFDLCTEAEQDVWTRVAVFAGGFEHDAAEAVCAGREDTSEPLADLALALVEKSILTAHDVGDHMRYRMLPPLRERGLRRLRQLGELATVRRRHRDFFVALAERAHTEWVSNEQVAWINRLRREEANMSAALAFCELQPGEAEPGLRMGANTLEFGLADGIFRPGRLWFARLLPNAPQPTLTRALALRTAAYWAVMQADLGAAGELVDEGEAIADRIGEPAKSLLKQVRAFLEMFSGDIGKAIALYEESLAGFRALGDTAETAHTLAHASLAYTLKGDIERALACNEECLAITEPAGECWYRSYSLWIAGLAKWSVGDVAGAMDMQRQSLRLKRLMNEKIGLGLGFEAIAWMIAPEQPERATVLLGAAQNQWEATETSTAALPGLFSFHERCEGLLRDKLGADGFTQAWRRGIALSTEEAVRNALDESRADASQPRPGRGDAAAPGVLTRREKQIAGLVAQGLTNGDIATQLVISKRTAETHVEHILTKLGFTSRHQITAWMAEEHTARGVSVTR